MQKSIEDVDSTVKENKDDIKSLMDRTKALEIQNTQTDDKIKELTDEINNTQQHQRNFSIRDSFNRINKFRNIRRTKPHYREHVYP